MKSRITIAILFFSFLGANHLVGQQPLFAPLGAVWHYDQYNCPGHPIPIETITWTVTEDTVINGKYCTVLYSEGCSNASCSNQVFVHQDGSKVFIYETLFDDFQMLYDFSLQTGASYPYIMCEEKWGVDTATIHVDFADADPIGVMHLRVTPNQPTWWGETGAEIVKGVGGLYIFNRLLFDEVFCQNITIDCPYYVFKCYETPDSINYPPDCFVSGVGEDFDSESKLQLFPNPTSNLLNCVVTTERPLSSPAYRVVSADGRVVVESAAMQEEESSFSIPVQNWAPGVYCVQLLEEGNLSAAQRFVVVH